MAETRPYSNAELLECARREVKMREHAYPRWVEQRKMTQERADRETGMMKAIVDILEPLAASERLI